MEDLISFWQVTGLLHKTVLVTSVSCIAVALFIIVGNIITALVRAVVFVIDLLKLVFDVLELFINRVR